MFRDDCIIAFIAKGFIADHFRIKKDTICIKRLPVLLPAKLASNTLRCNHAFFIIKPDSLTN